jgi:opacity protein-like surface antigen
MKRLIGGIAVVALAMGLVAEAASAQLASNPVYAINPGVGITLAGDFGRGLNDESGKTQFYGGRVILGVPMLSFWVGGGVWDPRSSFVDKQTALGGGAAINLIKAPVLPVALTLQVGGSTLSCGDECDSDIHLVAGPALRINVPTPGVGIEPWVMPRVHMSRYSADGETATQTGFGASAGINVNLPVGLGFHAAVDFSKLPDVTEGTLVMPDMSPMYGGIGIHYKIAVPSLGMPLVPVVN